MPLVLRTVGEGDASELFERIQALAARDPERLSRIVAGSARLELVDRLRVERSVEGQDFYATREWREIDQLTAFLAGTCIPIADGSPEGGESAFQDFLAALPGWAQTWLGRNYVVLPTGGEAAAALDDWLQMDPTEQCRLVGAHFAAVTRLYPTSVDYVPFDEHDRLHLTSEMHDAPFEFGWLHGAGDATLQREVGVGIRSGLSEAEALRFLLVVAFRQWLDSGDDHTLVDRYWRRCRVRLWSLRALKELENNVSHIHAWAGRALYERPAVADFAPISGLDDAAAQTLLAEPDDLSRFGGLDPQTLRGYLGRLAHINREIAALNERAEDPAFDLKSKAGLEDTLFSGVLGEADTRALLDDIQAIHQHLSRALSAAL